MSIFPQESKLPSNQRVSEQVQRQSKKADNLSLSQPRSARIFTTILTPGKQASDTTLGDADTVDFLPFNLPTSFTADIQKHFFFF